MGADATITTLSNILKTRYDQKVFHQLFYKNAPFAGMIRKDEKFGGYNARISLRYGSPQGGSADFATAQTNKTASADVGFLLTRARDYQVAGISGESLAAGEGDENTIYNALKGEMEGSMRNLNRSMQIQMWGNGGGARGKGDGAYSVAGATITLSIPSQIVNFEVGMVLQLSSTDGTSGAVRAGTLTVSAVDRVAGTITCTANVNSGITSPVNTDYIFRQGDHAQTSGVAIPAGVQAWIPASNPTSSAFFGVDRSVDVTRLGGVRFTGNGGNKEETLVDAAEIACREGADDLSCFMNNLDRADLVKSLGSKAIYEPVKSTDGVVGYKALIIEGPAGPIKVVSDINVPKGKFFLLQMDTWVMKSVKAAPRLLDDDGVKMLREASSDGYEWRMGAYYNVATEAPGYNTNGTF